MPSTRRRGHCGLARHRSRLQSSVALAISGQMIWTHSTVVEKGVDGHELDEVPRSEAHANRGAGSLNGWTVLSDGRVEGRETRRLTPLLGWSPTKWRTRASPFGTLPRRWTFRSSTPPSWRSRLRSPTAFRANGTSKNERCRGDEGDRTPDIYLAKAPCKAHEMYFLRCRTWRTIETAVRVPQLRGRRPGRVLRARKP